MWNNRLRLFIVMLVLSCLFASCNGSKIGWQQVFTNKTEDSFKKYLDFITTNPEGDQIFFTAGLFDYVYLVKDLENFSIYREERLTSEDSVVYVCFGDRIWIVNNNYQLESLDTNMVGLNYYPEVDNIGHLSGCYLDFNDQVWVWSDTSLATYNNGWSFIALPEISPYKFAITSDRTLWITTQDGQTYKRKKNEGNWMRAGVIPSKPVYHIEEFRDSSVVVGALDGIYQILPDAEQITTLFVFDESTRTYDFFSMENGMLGVTTTNGVWIIGGIEDLFISKPYEDFLIEDATYIESLNRVYITSLNEIFYLDVKAFLDEAK